MIPPFQVTDPWYVQPSWQAEDMLDEALEEIIEAPENSSNMLYSPRRGEMNGFRLRNQIVQKIKSLLSDRVEFSEVHNLSQIPLEFTRESMDALLQEGHVRNCIGVLERHGIHIPYDDMRRILLDDVNRCGCHSAASRLVRWYGTGESGLDTMDRGYLLDAVALSLTAGEYSWPCNSDGPEAEEAIVSQATILGWVPQVVPALAP